MGIRLLSCGFVATVLAHGAIPAQLFGAPTNVSTGLTSPGPLVVADVDGDGDPDVVVGDAFGSGLVHAMLGDGAGGFGTPVVTTASVVDLAAADLDDDGDVDLAGAELFSMATLTGDGSGGFTATTAGGCGGNAVAIADVTKNGSPDVVSAGATVCVAGNDGSGSFPSMTVLPPGGLTPIGGLALADVDNNGSRDIVTAGGGLFNPVGLTVHLNTAGTFAAPQSTATSTSVFGSFATGVAVGDLDGDIVLDAVMTVANGQDRVFMGDGLGGFTVREIADSIGGSGVAMADLDGDGDLDALVTRSGSNTLDHLDNDGTGTFTITSFAVGMEPSRVAISDIDADGHPDALVSNTGDGTISVLLNQRQDPTGITSFGLGTPGCAGMMGGSANSVATVGSATFGVSFTNVPPRTVGTAMFGIRNVGPPIVVLGLRIELLPTPLITAPIIVTNRGGTGFASIPILNNPSLVGLSISVQGLWLVPSQHGDTCSNAVLPLSSSKAVEITIQ